MEVSEITPDNIIEWANSYASYDELGRTAKAIYSIYKIEQREKYPKMYKAARQYKHKMKKKDKR